MSFWTKSNGEKMGATKFPEGKVCRDEQSMIIPDRTKVLAVLKSIELLPVREGKEADAQDGATLGYKVEWEVIEKGEYQGSIQRQGIKILATSSLVRGDALEMLAFMDNLFTGGRFIAADEEPDIAEMEAAFQNKPALIQVRRGESGWGNNKRYYNWVDGVFPYKEPEAAHKTPADAVNAAKEKISKGASQVAGAADNKPNQETAAERKARLTRELEEMERQIPVLNQLYAARDEINRRIVAAGGKP